MVKPHSLLAAFVAGACSLALPAHAQDATKEPAKPSTQSGPAAKTPTMQDCHERMGTKKGDKPMDADTDKACSDMMKASEMRHPDASKTAKKPAKTGSQSGEMPASAPADGQRK